MVEFSASVSGEKGFQFAVDGGPGLDLLGSVFHTRNYFTTIKTDVKNEYMTYQVKLLVEKTRESLFIF